MRVRKVRQRGRRGEGIQGEEGLRELVLVRQKEYFFRKVQWTQSTLINFFRGLL